MYDIVTRQSNRIYYHTRLSDEVFRSPSYQEELRALKAGEYMSSLVSVTYIPEFDVCPTCGKKAKRK